MPSQLLLSFDANGKFQPDPLQLVPASLVLGPYRSPGSLAALECPKPEPLCITSHHSTFYHERGLTVGSLSHTD